MKRVLFFIMLAAQLIAYIVLTESRYEGQGLTTVYFRLTTMSDLISLFYLFLVIGLIIAAIVHPERIGRTRSISIVVLSAILLWLDFGIRRTPAEDFTPEAAVLILLAMFAVLATLLTRSKSTLLPYQRFIKIVLNTAAILTFSILLAFIYAFFYPTYSRVEEIADFNPDAGVVLGAAVWRGHGLGDRPSPALRERIELGYDLLTKHAIPRIVVTGASAPGELAEAEVAKQDLMRRGVDESQIVEESASHTTLEQVRYIRDELYSHQKWTRFVIISDQYHIARVIEMCRFNGLIAIGSPSRIHQPFLDLLYYRLRESVALLEYWLLGR